MSPRSTTPPCWPCVDQLGEQGLVDFVNALLVVEQRQRLRLVWRQLFGEAAA